MIIRRMTSQSYPLHHALRFRPHLAIPLPAFLETLPVRSSGPICNVSAATTAPFLAILSSRTTNRAQTLVGRSVEVVVGSGDESSAFTEAIVPTFRSDLRSEAFDSGLATSTTPLGHSSLVAHISSLPLIVRCRLDLHFVVNVLRFCQAILLALRIRSPALCTVSFHPDLT
ncbi:hypothetical protein L227DRAFT_194554 [Lentinus tigrinus ALCF2SS1-6]|uniref:Uncharacterized protein n=1 Tax=Lentinus tigrinus ALCF2SS1-6 TaxID=1328759 RepID=A0A5C2S340_9APHY|nr:hypothetical protein L227DRAFT_194554 [Lentinus tigrinus ALCF2SS1-6]